MLVPNATVDKNEITVQTAIAVRTEAVVGVAYDTDLPRARQVARDVLLGTDGVADDPPPLALVGVSTALTAGLRADRDRPDER